MSLPKPSHRPPLACIVHLSEHRIRVAPDHVPGVASAIMADTRLSLEARGVALWLALHPHQGTIMTSVLRQHVGCKLEKWIKVARELEDGGYLVRDQQGGRGRWAWDTRFVVPDTINPEIAPTVC